MSYKLKIGGNMIQEIIDAFSNYMKLHDIKQEEAASDLGCCQEHLSRVLRGKKTPSVKLLMKMEEIMRNGH